MRSAAPFNRFINKLFAAVSPFRHIPIFYKSTNPLAVFADHMPECEVAIGRFIFCAILTTGERGHNEGDLSRTGVFPCPAKTLTFDWPLMTQSKGRCVRTEHPLLPSASQSRHSTAHRGEWPKALWKVKLSVSTHFTAIFRHFTFQMRQRRG